MLDLSRPPRSFGSTAVFRDHADPSKFFVLSSAPTIALDPHSGAPLLGLSLYRDEGSDRAAGLLQVELALTQPDEEAIAAWLRQQGVDDPQLVRPAFRRGTVRLGGWLETPMDGDEPSRLDPVSLGIGRPSLLPDAHTVIVAGLDQTGAAFADQALRGGGLATSVWYELEVLGLAGPLGIVVEADMAAIYDKLSLQGALTTPYGRARLAGAWEDFVTEGLVTVQIHDESLGNDEARVEALRRSAEAWIAELFEPAPPKASAATLDPSAPQAGVELQFLMRTERETHETHARWSYLERGPMPLFHRPAASLVDLLGDTDPASLIQHVDIDVGARSFAVRSIDPMERDGVESLSVSVRWGWSPPEGDATPADPVERFDGVLSPDQTQIVTMVDVDPREPFRYRVQAQFDPAQGEIAPKATPWLQARGGLLPLSTRRLFPPRSLHLVLGPVELDWLAHVQVVARCGDLPPRTVVLGSVDRTRQLVFLGQGGEPVRLEARWQGVEGEPSFTVPATETEAPFHQLASPFGRSLSIVLLPPAGDEVDTVTAELEYVDEATGFTHARHADWMAPDFQARTIALRTMAGGPRTWRLRTVITTMAGEVRETDWTEQDTLAVYLGEAEGRLWALDVVLLDGSPEALDLAAIEVVVAFVATGATATHLFEGPSDRHELVLLLPDELAPRWQITMRRFGSDGSVEERTFDREGTVIVLQWDATT